MVARRAEDYDEDEAALVVLTSKYFNAPSHWLWGNRFLKQAISKALQENRKNGMKFKECKILLSIFTYTISKRRE